MRECMTNLPMYTYTHKSLRSISYCDAMDRFVVVLSRFPQPFHQLHILISHTFFASYFRDGQCHQGCLSIYGVHTETHVSSGNGGTQHSRNLLWLF